jgi:hypothetical protein
MKKIRKASFRPVRIYQMFRSVMRLSLTDLVQYVRKIFERDDNYAMTTPGDGRYTPWDDLMPRKVSFTSE